MTAHTNRRRYPRVPVDLLTFIRKVDARQWDGPSQAAARDLSVGGVFLESVFVFDIGCLIEFDLLLGPNADRPAITIVGVVRWRRPAEPVGIGVEIVRVPPGDEAHLEHFIHQRLEETVPEE